MRSGRNLSQTKVEDVLIHRERRDEEMKIRDTIKVIQRKEKMKNGKSCNKNLLLVYSFILTFFNWSLLPMPCLIIGTGKKVRTDVLLWVTFHVHSQATP